MYRHFISLLAGAAICISQAQAREVCAPYMDPSLSVEQRVSDLLGRMTLQEKVGQLLCPMGWEMYTIKGDYVEVSEKFIELQQKHLAGMLWATFRADPWTQKTLDNGLDPRKAALAANAMQKYVIENTRLGIPIFLAEEAPHGHMAIGATVYPTGIGMAATWDPALIEKVGAAIGREVRTQGAHISYGPVLDLSRDPRWSRVEETMGEDPFLTGSVGAAMVKGLGGGDLSLPYSTIATLKHFLAYAVPEAGQNGNYSVVGTRDLYQNFLPPFRMAVKAGALSVMTSYNSIDGVPCTSNRDLLTGVLRDDWGFRGFTVSDLFSIDGLSGSHHVAASAMDGAVMALDAGVDVDLGAVAYQSLIPAAQLGQLNPMSLDRAVAAVLRLKFEMGLFENPYVDPDKAARAVNSKENVDLALDVARESVTLLKNSGVLPLSRGIGRVAVVGPNANVGYNQLGDYTAPQPDGHVSTVLDGVLSLLSPSQVVYARGCAVRDSASADIASAVDAARGADAVIAVVGGSSARDFKTSYKETGAAVVDAASLSDMESGEGYDRASISLMGRQQELLEALRATGKPLIVVYIEGRPLEKAWAADYADALLTAYYPGEQGGRAIADVIFGEYNPAGRLPFTVPRSVGQIPIYYNKKSPRNHDYVELSATPQYPFGFGLSYTSWEYSDLDVKHTGPRDYEFSFNLANTGARDGEEVVQLYIHDKVASTVQPLRQLKAYKRVKVAKGHTERVTLSLSEDDFAIIDAAFKETVEPGDFDIFIGPDSATDRLSTTITVR